jgi:hypothetical protein
MSLRFVQELHAEISKKCEWAFVSIASTQKIAVKALYRSHVTLHLVAQWELEVLQFETVHSKTLTYNWKVQLADIRSKILAATIYSRYLASN